MVHSRLPITPLTLVLAASLALPAEEVVITPARKTLFAGAPTRFRFHAEKKGAGSQPVWIWTVESMSGKPHPPGGGSITREGDYAPSAATLQTRVFRIRASAADDPKVTGTALVRVLPAAGITGLHSTLKPLGVQILDEPRIEHLAGAPDDERSRDARSGREVRFHGIMTLAAAPRVPWTADGKEVRDAWLLCDSKSESSSTMDVTAFRLVHGDGATETVATHTSKYPTFLPSRLAVRPWQGPGDGAWAAYFWNTRNHSLWRLGEDRKVTQVAQVPRPGSSGVSENMNYSIECRGLVVNAKGDVYLLIKQGVKDYFGARYRWTIQVWNGKELQVMGGKTWEGMETGHQEETLGLQGLALDPEHGRLLTLQCTYEHGFPGGYDACLVAMDTRDGKLTTLTKPLWRLPYMTFELSWFRGQVVVWDKKAKTFDLVDPEAGKAKLVHKEPGKIAWGLRPGPVSVDGAHAAGRTAGSMGSHLLGLAMDAEGRIAFASGNQVGLLLLDWEKLGLAAKAAAAPAAGETKAGGAGVETKASPGENKGDSKAAQ